MTISAFSLVKNERQFIGYGAMSILPHVDEVVYFDGNSTDGTLELLEYIQKDLDPEHKITVHKDRDIRDFRDDYVRVFNDCMKACRGEYLWYVHPDMIITEPGRLSDREKWAAKAYWVNMRSFAGEDMALEITKGRTDKWKTIMKNDFGLEYWGWYGADNEDMYFREITGQERVVHGNMRLYPFRVEDSGIRIQHMCECKPRKRREEKMENIFRTNISISGGAGRTMPEDIYLNDALANHPRVHLQTMNSIWGDFRFEPRKDPPPEVFQRYKEEFDKVLAR